MVKQEHGGMMELQWTCLGVGLVLWKVGFKLSNANCAIVESRVGKSNAD